MGRTHIAWLMKDKIETSKLNCILMFFSICLSKNYQILLKLHTKLGKVPFKGTTKVPICLVYIPLLFFYVENLLYLYTKYNYMYLKTYIKVTFLTRETSEWLKTQEWINFWFNSNTFIRNKF